MLMSGLFSYKIIKRGAKLMNCSQLKKGFVENIALKGPLSKLLT